MTERNEKSGSKEAPRLSLKERKPKGLQYQGFATPQTSKGNNEQRTFAPSFLEGSLADQTPETHALKTYERRKAGMDPFASGIPPEVIEQITDEVFSLNKQVSSAQRAINNNIVLFCAPLLAINAWICIRALT